MPVQFSTDDLRTPESLERVLRQFEAALAVPTPAPKIPTIAQLVSQLAPLIRDQLQAPGEYPINLQSLLPFIGSTAVQEGLHTDRTTLYTPPQALGSAFWETDRTVLYLCINSSGSLVWRYASGAYVAPYASRPADLGTNDTGFLFVASDLITMHEWSGTTWNTVGGLYQTIVNAAGAAVTTLLILQHLASVAGGAGMGVRLEAQLQDDAGTPNTRLAGADDWLWSTAATGVESADRLFSLRVAGTLTNILRLIGVGGHARLLTAGARLQFEGATASFPALTRGATTTNTRSVLADGSASTDHEVADEAYGSSWNGSVEVPTKNAVYDKLQEVFGSYTDFTPTYSSDVGNAAATFTATPTTTLARYKANGKTMHVEVSIQATLNALVTPAVIYMTFPVAPSGADVWGGGVMLANAGTFENGLWRVLGGPDRVGFFRGNFALFTAGVAIDIRHSFVFDLA